MSDTAEVRKSEFFTSSNAVSSVAADVPVDIRDRLLEEEFPVCVGQSAVSLRPDTGGGAD